MDATGRLLGVWTPRGLRDSTHGLARGVLSCARGCGLLYLLSAEGDNNQFPYKDDAHRNCSREWSRDTLLLDRLVVNDGDQFYLSVRDDGFAGRNCGLHAFLDIVSQHVKNLKLCTSCKPNEVAMWDGEDISWFHSRGQVEAWHIPWFVEHDTGHDSGIRVVAIHLGGRLGADGRAPRVPQDNKSFSNQPVSIAEVKGELNDREAV